MLEKELLIFTVLVFIAKYLWDNFRFFRLGFKIPKNNFDTSVRGIYNVLFRGNKTFFRMLNDSNVEGISRAFNGSMLFVTVTLPEDIKFVMNAKGCIDKPWIFQKTIAIEEGSLFGNINAWRSHRKILNPFFRVQSLCDTVIPIFNATSNILIENIATMDGKGEFDVFKFMTAQTLETILKVMEFDFDVQNQRGEKRDVFIHNLEM